jgi:hypothetical protein
MNQIKLPLNNSKSHNDKMKRNAIFVGKKTT